tara:strand:- start:8 stop:310 length:303 start_codon:yes stop_codon:yes gene_type:complete
MIQTIIDKDGFLIYKGDNSDDKFKKLLSLSGSKIVNDNEGDFIKPKWNGSKWTEGYVATYKEQREEAYPSIPDQLDDLYHNGIDGWKTTIKAVKDKYPKG